MYLSLKKYFKKLTRNKGYIQQELEIDKIQSRKDAKP